MLSDYLGGERFTEFLVASMFAALWFVLGVGWAVYRAVSWVDRMKEWARVVTITEAELDTLNGPGHAVDIDVDEIAGGVILVVTPDDCAPGTKNQLAGLGPADSVLFDPASSSMRGKW